MGRQNIKGNELEHYLSRLAAVRTKTLSELSKRDAAWLYKEVPMNRGGHLNAYWQWFHVLEDEVNHRGQIRLLKKMLAR